MPAVPLGDCLQSCCLLQLPTPLHSLVLSMPIAAPPVHLRANSSCRRTLWAAHLLPDPPTPPPTAAALHTHPRTHPH